MTFPAHQNWPELRYVPVELKGIIRDEDAGGTTGILRGRIMLDEAFTEKKLRDALIRQLYRVVQIASHFKFDADGNSNDSFLLLGNGKLTKLTIAQIFCSYLVQEIAFLGGSKITGTRPRRSR